MKKNTTKRNTVIISALVVVLALVLGFTSMANQSFKQMIADRAGEILGLSLVDKIDIDETETLGGSGGVFQTDWFKVGNRVTWIKSGQFVDNSVVLFSIPNPATGGTATSTNDLDYNDDTHMTGTSTVLNVNLDITGLATTTALITCGGAADRTAVPTYDLLNVTLPTSTIGVFSNGQSTTTS